tara:strand:- start:6 stop:1157 length:1152 start_codon:yes stop_codon:yes gene_type:complete
MIEFNKKLIFRKFFLDNTYFFIISLATLSVIVWVIQAVNFLDFVTEDGHGLLVYLKYTLLAIPKIISKLMPFIFFISIFYTLNKFEDNNELKIFWIFGTNKNEFLKVVLKYSFIILFIQLCLTLFVVPLSQNKSRTYIQSSSIDFFPSLINEKRFIDTVEKLTIYVEEKNNKEYKKIYLKDNKNKNKVKIIFAETGNLVNNQNGRFLNLYDGKIININQNNITSFDFKNTTFDLSKYLTKSIIDFKIQERDSMNILNCYINFYILKNQSYYHPNDCNEGSSGMFRQEIYKRIFKPFFFLSLGMVICFLLLFSKENQNYKIYRLGVFLFGVSIIIISEFIMSISSASLLYFQLSIIFTFLLFFILMIFLIKKFNFNKIYYDNKL